MCGIAGRLSLGTPTPVGTLEKMAQAIAHRGPDGQATTALSDGDIHLGLAHRRLKIIDLSERADQPMYSHDRNAVVVFNGEIYNYIELRAELQALGRTFNSASDTEVLLAAWQQWGRGMLPRLNGMFALAIWDARERLLFLARDRFGEKPLFYQATPEAFSFGSEIRALLPAIGGGALSMNTEFLYRFLRFGRLENEPSTFANGVSRLLPGHLLEVRRGNGVLTTRTERWYSIPPRVIGSGDDAVARYRDLFDDAVRIRLRSDVPLGSSLSGGLDSSAVVATLGTLIAQSDARHTFTCRMEDPRLDEGRYATEVARSVHAMVHEVTPAAHDLAADFDTLCNHQEEPFPSASIYAQWRVFRLARESEVTVLLDGQGADETLAGYPWYAGVAAAERLARLSVQEARRMLDAGPVNARRAMLITALGDAFREQAPAPLRRLAEHFRPVRGAASAVLVSGEARKRFGVPEARRVERGKSDWLDKVLRFSVEHGALQGLLRFADRNSMAFGREVRLPFLDHRLVELTFALPEEWKIGAGTTKRVLREAMAGRVPDAVRLRRDKLGFEAPDALWLTGPLRDWFRTRVRAAASRFSDLLDSDRVEAALSGLEGPQKGALVAALFPLVSAESCARNFFGGAPP